MANIIKNEVEENTSKEFVAVNKIIKGQILKRNILFRAILLIIAGLSLKVYSSQFTEYYDYFTYIFMLSVTLFLFSFIFLRNKFRNYQSYHKQKLSRKDKQAIKRYKAKLLDILKSNDFKVLNNVYLPCGGDYLQQLDSVIVGPAGVYVIELINKKGVIEGMASGKEWKDDSGSKIINHFKQNEKHISQLEDIIYDVVPEDRIKVNNLVINLNLNSNFNMPDKGSHPIFDNLYDALYWIKKNERQVEFEMTPEQNKQLVEEILAVHFAALKRVEYNLNKSILSKYDLEDKFLS